MTLPKDHAFFKIFSIHSLRLSTVCHLNHFPLNGDAIKWMGSHYKASSHYFILHWTGP